MDKINGIEIIRPLKKGGMGAVYLARQVNVEREVAVKVLRPEFSGSGEYSDRFVREARIAANLSHLNLVTIHHFGRSKNNFFLVMEFLKGNNLEELIAQADVDQGDPVVLDEAYINRVFFDIAKGLQEVHKNGLVHRDLKPANIVFRDTENTVPVLTDFGVARTLDDSLNITRTNLIIGTPKYMSPEQVTMTKATSCSDIYSFAFMFFETLVGKLPYKSAVTSEVGLNERKEVPQMPKHLRHYQAFFDKALAYHAKDRFQSVAEMFASWPLPKGEQKTVAQNSSDALGDSYSQNRPWYKRERTLTIATLGLAVLGVAFFLESYESLGNAAQFATPPTPPAASVAPQMEVQVLVPDSDFLCLSDRPWMLGSKLYSAAAMAGKPSCGALRISTKSDAVLISVLSESKQGGYRLLWPGKCESQALYLQPANSVMNYPGAQDGLAVDAALDLENAKQLVVLTGAEQQGQLLCEASRELEQSAGKLGLSKLNRQLHVETFKL